MAVLTLLTKKLDAELQSLGQATTTIRVSKRKGKAGRQFRCSKQSGLLERGCAYRRMPSAGDARYFLNSSSTAPKASKPQLWVGMLCISRGRTARGVSRVGLSAKPSSAYIECFSAAKLVGLLKNI